MRILIDECLPRKLKRELPEHDVRTVQEMKGSGLKNGALLRRMDGQFDIFITIDGNLEYQQDLGRRTIAVIVPQASNNKTETLAPLVQAVRARLNNLKPGEIVRIGYD